MFSSLVGIAIPTAAKRILHDICVRNEKFIVQVGQDGRGWNHEWLNDWNLIIMQ